MPLMNLFAQKGWALRRRAGARRPLGVVAALCAPLLVLALTLTIAPATACAAVSSVKTASTVPSYQNPATGQIEDAGGASNQALGESMVSSTTDANALIEQDAQGKVYITLRVHLADAIKSVSIEASSDGGNTFAAVEATKMQEDLSHGEMAQENYADWRFEAPSADPVLRVKLDVVPMGREVTYFVKLANPVDGNTAGFVQTVTPGEGTDENAATTSDDAKSDEASKSDDSSKDSKKSDKDSSDDLNAQSGSSSAGISEYNADGNKVNGDAVQPLSGATVGIVVAVAVIVVVVAGGIYYALVLHPKRAKQAAAAAAAADDAFAQAAGADPVDAARAGSSDDADGDK